MSMTLSCLIFNSRSVHSPCHLHMAHCTFISRFKSIRWRDYHTSGWPLWSLLFIHASPPGSRLIKEEGAERAQEPQVVDDHKQQLSSDPEGGSFICEHTDGVTAYQGLCELKLDKDPCMHRKLLPYSPRWGVVGIWELPGDRRFSLRVLPPCRSTMLKGVWAK